MNRLLLAIALLFFSGAFAQQQAPPKKSTKVIVSIKDSANSTLSKLSSELFDLGYTIDVKDDNAKYIITKEKPSKRFGTMTKIRARVNDTAIVFTGQIAINSDSDILGTKEAAKTFYDVDYRGGKKNPMLEAWNELEAIARKFGSNITYSK